MEYNNLSLTPDAYCLEYVHRVSLKRMGFRGKMATTVLTVLNHITKLFSASALLLQRQYYLLDACKSTNNICVQKENFSHFIKKTNSNLISL